MLQETKLSTVCEKVLDRCLAPSTAGGEGCYNMTMILVQFKKPAQSSAPAEEQSSSNVEAEAQGEPKLERSEV
jgi:protein phosphatase 1G